MSGQEDADPGAKSVVTRRKSMARSAGNFCLRLVAAAVGAGAVLCAAAAWRLSQGPVSLGFMTPYVEEAMQLSDTDLRVSLDDTVLTWAGWERTLDIRAVNVRIGDATGSTVAVVPEVSLGLGAREIVRGSLAPNSIDLIGLKLRIVRRVDGRVDLGIADDGGEEGGRRAMAAILQELVRDGEDRTGLRRVSVLDAQVVFDDQKSLTSVLAHAADLVMWRDLGGIRGNLDFAVEIGGHVARMSMVGHYDQASGKTGLTANFAQLEPAALAVQGGLFSRLAALRLPVSGSIDLSIDETWTLQEIAFDLAAGPGDIDLPEYFPELLPIDRITARGTMDTAAGSVALERFRIADGESAVTLDGSVDLNPEGVGVSLQGGLSNIPVDKVVRYWPPKMAAGARKWIDEHIHTGVVDKGDVRVHLTPEMLADETIPEEAVLLTLNLRDVTAEYLRTMTKITEGAGSARLTAKTFELTVQDGAVGPLRLSEGALSIANLGQKDLTADISFVVSGNLADQLALIDMPPLQLTRKLGVSTADIGGIAATRAHLLVPLKRGLKLDMIGVAAATNMSGASLDNLLGKWSLDQGALTLRADKTGLEMEGKARLNGVPVDLEWVEEFQPQDAYSSQYKITGQIDDQGRRAFNLTLDPWLRGPVAVDLEVKSRRGGAAVGQVALDFRAAEVDIEPIAWRKEAETEGLLTFDLAIAPGEPTSLDNMRFEGGGLTLAGEADVAASGALERLSLSQLDYGATRLALTWVAQPGGTFATIVGSTLDLRPQIEAFLVAEPDNDDHAGPRLDTINLEVDRVLLRDGLTLRDFGMKMDRVGDRPVRLEADGVFANGSPVSARLVTNDNKRQLQVLSDDAGTIARALGIYDNIVGGEFRLEGAILDEEPGAPFEGRIKIDKFKLVRAPVLAKMLSVGSLTGIGDVLGGEGIGFTRARIPVRTEGSKIVVEKARAHGPALGITGEGIIDRATSESDFAGNLIPAYTLNSVLGYIPLLGKLLVPEGEGIFGLAYRVSGPTEDPNVTVNPLSALTPGILRSMFFPAAGNADGGTELDTSDWDDTDR